MNKRKNKNDSSIKLSNNAKKSILVFFLSLGVLLYCAAQLNKISQTLYLIGVFVAFALTIAITVFVNSVFFKGKVGEIQIASLLKRIALFRKGQVINDVIIPDELNSSTSQIDHIYIDKSGIYVIETKNYSGRIYGKKEDDEWTQVLSFGKVKNRFYSPYKQNTTHLIRLAKYLNIGSAKLTNIVIFTNKANISHIACENVFTPKSFKKFIKKNKIHYVNEFDVTNYSDKLKFLKEHPIKTSKEHIKEIKKRQTDINNNICPRCGGTLLLRTSKNGNQFYGCSNYPKCKFTKRID